MSLKTLFNRRVRGVRLIELWAFGFALVLGLGVYLSKTSAGGEGAEIASLQREIGKETQRVRLLKAEVAYLEQPGRIGQLSTYLGLAPLRGDRDIEAVNLAAAAAGQIKVKPPAPPPPPPPPEEPIDGQVAALAVVPAEAPTAPVAEAGR